MGVVEPAAGCVAVVASAGVPSSPFCPDVSAPAIVAELGRTSRSSSRSCFSATVLAAGESASSSLPRLLHAVRIGGICQGARPVALLSVRSAGHV